EEWLPSAPVHILLWEYLGWRNAMPQWAHLPLILKPDGNGKLSKRDGDRLGFPVYAMNWEDPQTGAVTEGFREMGFLPEAFVNLLATLGWNDGSDQELFALHELIDKFSLERISKAGAKFDFEKAKWFNHEWIKRSDDDRLSPQLTAVLADHGITLADEKQLSSVLALVKERLTFVNDFWAQASFFFKRPERYDLLAVQPRWNVEKTAFFVDMIAKLENFDPRHSAELESFYRLAVEATGMKTGGRMLPLRIMRVRGKFGPHVFDSAALLGREETGARMNITLEAFTQAAP